MNHWIVNDDGVSPDAGFHGTRDMMDGCVCCQSSTTIEAETGGSYRNCHFEESGFRHHKHGEEAGVEGLKFDGVRWKSRRLSYD